ncbi:hypothetical protein AAG570_012489 [Ranatra chinensis]|uniref:Uncharacterized protein n=1 Tax=Ranatra chinensis TaxID=642074 RepID=A0ABD0YFX1_9HEMI
MFLSPRQFHLLIELMEGLAAPHTQDTSNVNQRNRCIQKPMNPGDFEKVEQELQDTLHSPTTPHIVTKSIPRHGWSSASIGKNIFMICGLSIVFFGIESINVSL